MDYLRTAPFMNITEIVQNPASLLQQPIRFDTSNPPGDKGKRIAFIDTVFVFFPNAIHPAILQYRLPAQS
ncbi:MAG: hypothetical protein HYZ26_10220 [Chloroflexi bacterium]|nr:hypothetical protein [Chloroflexota bacterium]